MGVSDEIKTKFLEENTILWTAAHEQFQNGIMVGRSNLTSEAEVIDGYDRLRDIIQEIMRK